MLQGVFDPEQKRKTIGREFIENFKDFANSLEKKGLPKPKFLVQGTLYPDVIESCPPPGSGQKHSHTIKSHHNVGGLPKDLQFTLIEPLKELFKVCSYNLTPSRLSWYPDHVIPGPQQIKHNELWTSFSISLEFKNLIYLACLMARKTTFQGHISLQRYFMSLRITFSRLGPWIKK